ncbi:tetratricopeptide repeat protein [Desulfurobacterium sp.]
MKLFKKLIIYTTIAFLPSAATAGTIVYSWQLGTFNNQKQAEKFINKLPESIRKKAFIYITDRGKITVRFNTASTIKELQKWKEILKTSGIKNPFVAPTDIEKLKEPSVYHSLKNKKNGKKKAEKYYSIQLGTFKTLKQAIRFINKLPQSLKEKVFIYRTDSGFYTVRVGISNSLKKLKTYAEKLPLLGIKNFFFVPTSPKKIKQTATAKTYTKSTSREEILKTALLIFLGNNNIKEAYEVAKKGTKLFPDNKFWWEWLAKISLWLNNQPEALQAYKKLYFKFNDEKVFHSAYSLALSLGDDELARKLIEEEIKKGHKVLMYKDLIAFFRKMGDVNEGVKLAEKVYGNNPELIKEAALIYWFYGEKEKALKELEKLKRLGRFGYKEALTEAKIYISDRKFEKALSVLKDYSTSTPKTFIEYWQLMGNLAWALGDYETAAKSSEVLVNQNAGQDFDFSRIILFYANKKPEKAMHYALKGYEKTGIEDFMIDFLSLASKLKKWNLIVQTINSLPEKRRKKLLSENYPLSVYLLALSNTGKVKEARKLMELELKKRENSELIEEYLYFLMDNNEINALKKALSIYRNYSTSNPYPFIAAYLYLQDGKDALRLIRKIKIPPSDFSMALTRADILELYGKSEEAEKIRFNLFKKMKQLIKKDGIFTNPDELVSYLRVAMYYEPPEKFREELNAAKKLLPETVYKELYYSFLIKSGQTGKADYLITRNRERVSRWLQLNLALYKNDRYKMMDLTSHYGPILPIRDRVTALTLEGKPGKALNVAFNELENNPYDEELYRQMRDLDTQYRNYTSFSQILEDRTGLYDLNTKAEIKYGKKGNGIYTGITAHHFNFLNHKNYKNLPDRTFIQIYVEKILSTTTTFKGGINVIKNARSNQGVFINCKTLLYHRTEASVSLYSATEASESIYLISGGYKRNVEFAISYPLLDSVTITSNLNWNQYFSADNKNLGSGFTTYNELLYKLRAGYPDFTFKGYLLKTIYSEKSHSNSTVDNLSPYPPADVLPESSWEIGGGFEFGYENRYNYVRPWRPFFHAGIGYNTHYGWGISTGAGIGGMITGKDNLNLGIDFSINPASSEEKTISVEFNYKKWF